MPDHEDGHAVSSAQEQLWFVDQLRSGASEYLLHQAVRVRGPLDTTALRAALTGISARHEILRTRYDTVDGCAVQVIDPPGPVDVDLVDLGDPPAGDRESRLDEVLEAALDAPFDLREDAPLRARLIRFAADDHVLLFVVHHIAFDGWSWGVLARELHALYGASVTGRPGPLPPLPVQYADFAAWQRENWLAGPHVDAQLGYWRERLSGLAPLDLPTDRPRPAHWRAAGDGLTFTVPADLATALTRLGADRGATPFMVFLAAFQLLLGRYAGQTDVAVGVSVAGRHEVELEDLIGLFVNTVVLRADLAAPACFLDLLDQVRGTTLDAYDNQQVPFDRIVAELSPERDLSRNPLFQVGFGLHNADRAPFALPGLAVTEQPTSWTSAAFDLSLQLVGRPDGSYHGEVVFPTALFDGPRVHRMVANYRQLLSVVVAGQVPLDELDLLAPRERREVLGGWSRGADRAAGPGLPELFLAQAAATPDATALIADDGTEVGYAELAGRARKLAAHLHTVGVRVGTPVGVAVHRGPDLVTALLGVLLAGGVYVPLAPDQPVDRLEFMAADAGVSVLVTETALRGLLSAGDAPVVLVDAGQDTGADAGRGADDAAWSPPATDPDAAAYVMYTSGSTGRPKGVVVTHAGIRNRVLWSVEQYRLTAADRVLQKTALGFDASLWEFLAPLVSGGAVVLAAPDAHRDPGAMLRAVRAHDVTVLQLVPSVLRVLLHESDLSGCAALRVVCSAGEPLPVALCEQLQALLAVEIWNTYGPTECAIDATAWRYRGDEGTGTVPIGGPLPGCTVLVLDADDRPVPVGVAGQLCLGGVGLARGYLGRPALTGERFTPNPYGATPGERLYRTGDLARWRDDGSLEYLGRLDHQVKLHGVRIEPGEVEAALRRHPSVDTAVVTLHRPPSGDAELVAYVVPAGGARIDPDGLRDTLADRLPAAMVPSTVISLAALPLTANGKLDRAALPTPDGPRPGADRRYLPPATDTERVVAGIWAELLGVERIGRNDNFFTLGGHSMLAIRGVLRVRRALEVELTVGQLFAAPTVAALAALVDGARPGAGGSTGEPADTAIRPVARDGDLPLSLGQRRMWFLDQLEPGSLEYLIPISMRLTGPFDVAVFRRTVDEVVNRHEILRTRYRSIGGEPAQVVDPPGPVGWELIDLSGAPDVVEGAEALLRVAAGRPFDLATERPIRAQVIRVAADEHLVALTLHHIAFDVWSMEILLRELDTLYRRYARGGAATVLPDLPVQYADFAAWEAARQDSPNLDAQLAYWSRQLAGSTPLELPTDRPRPALRDPAGDNVVVDVPTDVGRALAELANREGATLFMVLLAAFQIMLGRYARQHDVAVGTPVAGRTRQETEDLLGFFVNNLVMRAELGDDQPFAVLLDQVRRTVTDAFRNQDVAFERLVDALRPDRDLSRNPLFQVMFELQHLERMTGTLGPTTIEHVDSAFPVAKFDLTLSVEQHPDGRLRCWFEYATALWDRCTVERMAGHYLHLLAQVAAAPGTALRDLTLPTGVERAYLVGPWAGEPAAPLGDAGPAGAGVVELFGRRVRQHPDVVAVEFDGRRLTFAELDSRANRLAHHLRGLGVRPEVPVAVCLERGLEVVVTLLAVLKAGGVYLPVDPDHPTERLRFMLADAGATVVVTEARFADRVAADGVAVVAVDADRAVIAGRDATAPDPSTGSDDLAYVIYTSGSTGRPKGVMIPHGAYAHHCEVIARAYDIGPGDRVVLLSALTFDVAMDGMVATLLAGATLVVSDPVFWSPAELPDRLARHRITHMEITPAYYREVMDALPADDDRLRHLKLMNVGSDVVTVADARRWAATGLPGRFLVNYGPTEATVTCLLHPVTGDPPGERTEALPIGRPVPGTRAYVVDEHLNLVPVGVPGELLLGGARLARGYLDRPAPTADRFVPDPFGDDPGGRLYRSGDLVRYRPDGTIEFLGRIDQQVKIRGFRMELGEIESALTEHPAVRAVAVVARETQPGEKGLVAYLVCRDGTPPAVAELRAHLRDRLPDYMVPAQWMVLDALPLTTSKKVDRRALPAPTPVRADPGRAYEAPRTPLEEAVADIWATVLEVDRVGVHDDFFDLGGHSLLATRVLAHLRQSFDLDLPLRLLFEQTTVADLADAVHTAIENEISRLSDAEVAELLKEGNL
ncbi:amino acid adenylation domain-containing protein [Micromonospora sp. C31]|uniref:non-ribosomal peptide synthetase n=1 Tax=Micromonospora sp. C31 TaxID=2824876 RepID=UPI001B35CA28|nr:non-ribosomal peptide synthetase [Micromonospora sp. C31]MBQ1075158.1 amino acid adenylation domain-containing protein [Micromonospora sp. C31]